MGQQELGEISWFLDPEAEADKQRSKLTFKVSYSNIIDQKLEHYNLHEASSSFNPLPGKQFMDGHIIVPAVQCYSHSVPVVTATAIVILIQYNL